VTGAREPGRDGEPALTVGRAVALGLMHGPAELLPISSSAHVTLVPWLAGWPYGELEPEVRKAFEVALHAGTAAGLLVAMRAELAAEARSLDGRRAGLIALACAPAAVAGMALERPVERHLGSPRAIAAGLLAGSAALVWGERRALRRRARGLRMRTRAGAGVRDALWIGAAQACALAPGVSRSGATIAAARARGFAREDAFALSWETGLPVIAGATALKLARAVHRPVPPGLRGAFAAGAGAAFVSTLLACRALPRTACAASPLPAAAYRAALGGAAIRRVRKNAVR
jgi:undecaprenyl-diphosphatase